MGSLTTMHWVPIEVISKDRKKIYLPLRGIKFIQTHTFRNILNDLASIALNVFPSDGDNTRLILVKASESDDIGCPMLKALEFNLDATTTSFFSQACLDSFKAENHFIYRSIYDTMGRKEKIFFLAVYYYFCHSLCPPASYSEKKIL